MSDFLKKLKQDLDEGKKAEFLEVFSEIVEKAENKTYDKDALNKIIPLRKSLTEEERKAVDEEAKNTTKKREALEAKELDSANITMLLQTNEVLWKAYLENNDKINELMASFQEKHGESYWGETPPEESGNIPPKEAKTEE